MLTRDNSNSSLPSTERFEISRREPDQRTSVISVQGELGLATAPRLKWMLIEALESGHSQLVVDLSLVSFMDSTALGVFVAFNRGLDADARLAIASPQPDVVKIFELSGMDGVFAIFPGLQDALAYVQGHTTTS
ncbi:MAG TPA: STAS domain-containing protein [Solirubrobacteraceae bacterium]|jgi:anti-sigma B factor antagonist